MNEWMLRLISLILGVISGPLREELIAFALAFREKAKKTSNPWDDYVADIICWA
ncbi:unnamed protein product, partial [marine sediment metagenome]